LGFFRRERLHERLAREGGLDERAASPEPIDVGPPPPGVPGFHGLQRPRRWDAVVMVDAPDLHGDTVELVLLEGRPVVSGAEPIAAALDDIVGRPYRAEAVRRHGDVWAAAAQRIEVLELPGVEGHELMLTMQDGTKTLTVDGSPEFGTVPELERYASERYASFVAEARRLEGDLFEVRVSAL
jgi:hypothetical protein